VRRFERRSVVHPVACHRHDFTVRLECIDQAQFLLGNNTGENVHVMDALPELDIVHRVQLRPRDDLVLGCQPDLPGDIRKIRHAMQVRPSGFADSC
jgi:hypothetical protein